MHPELWAELEELAHTQNLVSRGFKYGIPFSEVNCEVDMFIQRENFEQAQIRLEGIK